MKAKWIILKKDGSILELTTDVESCPNIGDGNKLGEETGDINVVVISKVTGNGYGEFDCHIFAREI